MTLHAEKRHEKTYKLRTGVSHEELGWIYIHREETYYGTDYADVNQGENVRIEFEDQPIGEQTGKQDKEDCSSGDPVHVVQHIERVHYDDHPYYCYYGIWPG